MDNYNNIPEDETEELIPAAETVAAESSESPIDEEIPAFTSKNELTDNSDDTPEVPAKPKHSHFLRNTVAAILALALVAGSGSVGYLAASRQWEMQKRLSTATIEQLSRRIDVLQASMNTVKTGNAEIVNTGMAIEGEKTPRQIFAENASSVVGISSTIQSIGYAGQTTTGTSTGSGFILTENGYVVTNYHVIDGATSVTVVLDNEEEYTAKIVGYDTINDVAVLKIEAEGLPAVKLGRSDDLFVGDYVVAIGNPLGTLTATMTYGIISGKDRQVTTDRTIINMLQTDAAINSGNSGGPLFNMKGEVIGITTAKYSGSTNSGASIEGIGFAIPIDDVLGTIGDLRDFGYVTGAYLGVTVQDTDAAAASLYGLPTGAYVVTVVEGGSADRAGVQPKDIIIALGDHDVSNVSELTRTLRRYKANDTTTITVIRSGERKTLNITLDEKPRDLNSTPETEKEEMPMNGSYDEWYKYFFGQDGVPKK